MLLAEAVATYVGDRRARGEISAESARQFAWRLAGLVRLWPGLEVGELARAHVLAWQATIGGQRPASRRGYLSTVKTFARWALEAGLLESDPTAGLAKVREPRGLPRALTASQVARLELVLPDDRARMVVGLMLGLGLRCCEVARLEVGDYDPGARVLRVTGKGGHVRELPVLDDLAARLEGRIGPRRAGPLVFCGPRALSRLVSGWMTEAGIKGGRYDGVSAHALRHTAASELLEACGNLRTVQDFLGHANLATTDRYLRRANLDQMRAALVARAS